MPSQTSFSSYLTSPTIRLIPDPDRSTSCSDAQYIVHRALLTTQSQYLKKRTRESYIILEGTSEETVKHFLEFVYRGDYTIPEIEKAEEVGDEEEELHPVVQAARDGAVGVWARKPAVFGRRYSYGGDDRIGAGIRSKYIDMASGKMVYHHIADSEVKGKQSAQQQQQVTHLPSPPASPTTEKEFNLTVTHKTDIAVPQQAPYPLAAYPLPKPTREQLLQKQIYGHLNLYLLSVRYTIFTLAHLSLSKLSSIFETGNPSIGTITGIIRAVYGDERCTKGTRLRQFLARYSAGRIAELRKDGGFLSVLGMGGEFVVDMVGWVGAEGDVWVR